jgi:hypothetical protein
LQAQLEVDIPRQNGIIDVRLPKGPADQGEIILLDEIIDAFLEQANATGEVSVQLIQGPIIVR